MPGPGKDTGLQANVVQAASRKHPGQAVCVQGSIQTSLLLGLAHGVAASAWSVGEGNVGARGCRVRRQHERVFEGFSSAVQAFRNQDAGRLKALKC